MELAAGIWIVIILVMTGMAFFIGRVQGAKRAESELETAKAERVRAEEQAQSWRERLDEAQAESRKNANDLGDQREENATLRNQIQATEQRLTEERARLQEMRKEIENTFKVMSEEALRTSREEFLKAADEKFKNQSKFNADQLSEKEKLINQSLENMGTQLKDLLTRSTELKTELTNSQQETNKLRDTTDGLRLLLASSQSRGQWGERMVEDILQYIGLQEHINYTKQSVVESGERPDYTFLLPKGRKINMDVKFPLTHYERYLHADLIDEQTSEKVAFLKDVKNHLKTISKREYIDTSAGTVDYVMMFIPNEAIYGFINKEDPEMVDFALSNRIMLCSPITLYAVLSLLHQATSNFMMEQKATEIMEQVKKFQQQWTKFTEQMNKVGKYLDQAVSHFQALTSTRSRALEKPVGRIIELQKAAMIEAGTDQLSLTSGNAYDDGDGDEADVS